MDIQLNGRPETLHDGSTILDLLNQTQLANRRVAVEVNQAIVPKSRHATHQLSAGDVVEIVHALGGG